MHDRGLPRPRSIPDERFFYLQFARTDGQHRVRQGLSFWYRCRGRHHYWQLYRAVTSVRGRKCH